MTRPEKDPFPLATDLQALARLISNCYYTDQSYDMEGTYFSAPFPQTIHALVYSVMTATAHTGFEFLTLIRKSDKKILPYESNQVFKSFFVASDSTNANKPLRYVESLKADFKRFFFEYVFPYFSDRLQAQSDITLTVKEYPGPLLAPARSDRRYLERQPIDSRLQSRAKILGFLVNNVIFPTLLTNNLKTTAETLYKILVFDYGLPAELFGLDFSPQENKGRKRDFTGQKFGRLYVLRESESRSKGGHILWDCICDCGTLVPGVPSADLTRWRAFSCGSCYPKSITDAVLDRARIRGKQAFYAAACTCAKRATDLAERSLSKSYDRYSDSDYDTELYLKKKLIHDRLLLLPGPSMILAVAGLPINSGATEKQDKGAFDLHRAGHERLISQSPTMPYASSTICWVPRSINKKHLADCIIMPYRDGPPELRLKGSRAQDEDADLTDLL